MEDEVDFWPADNLEISLQIDSITLAVRSQACPKYSRQQLYNIFEGRNWFFACRWKSKISSD